MFPLEALSSFSPFENLRVDGVDSVGGSAKADWRSDYKQILFW